MTQRQKAARALREAGFTLREIAALLGIAYGTAHGLIRKAEKNRST